MKTMLFWGLALLLYQAFKNNVKAPSHKRYILLVIVLGGLLLNVPLPHLYSPPEALILRTLPVIEATSPVISSEQTDFTWPLLWSVIYFSGVIVYSIVFLNEIGRLVVMFKNAEPLNDYFRLKDSGDLFSFLGMIFIGDRVDLNEKELQMALLHERQHVQSGHSYDIILISLLQIIFWFFPIWPWLKKELQLVHELEADQKVIIKYDAHQYAGLLVRMSKRGALSSVHYFAQSLTKKRLKAMIHHHQSSITKPLLGIFLISFLWLFIACADEQEKPVSQIGKTNVGQVEDKASTSSKKIESDVLQVAEVMPVLKKCEGEQQPMGCLIQNFYNHVKYPETARAESIEGTSVVSFIVDLNGRMTDIEVIRKISPSIDAEAERAVREFAENYQWVPGKQDGKDVKVKMHLPIKFKLD